MHYAPPPVLPAVAPTTVAAREKARKAAAESRWEALRQVRASEVAAALSDAHKVGVKVYPARFRFVSQNPAAIPAHPFFGVNPRADFPKRPGSAENVVTLYVEDRNLPAPSAESLDLLGCIDRAPEIRPNGFRRQGYVVSQSEPFLAYFDYQEGLPAVAAPSRATGETEYTTWRSARLVVPHGSGYAVLAHGPGTFEMRIIRAQTSDRNTSALAAMIRYAVRDWAIRP